MSDAARRQDMVRAFQAAFDEWERRNRLHPDSFTGSLGQRGAYFADLLDELADGRPWAEIGR